MMILSEYPQDKLGPAASFVHKHPVKNANMEFENTLTLGQKVADRVATVIGSWPFILTQSGLLIVWVCINAYLAITFINNPGGLKAWDPYPFILLNLVLSLQAAYTGPIVMMSQNRQSYKDRISAQLDYDINEKAEEEIEVIMRHLVHQDKMAVEMNKQLKTLQNLLKDIKMNQ